MTIEEWCAANPDVTVEQVVQELCEWRQRALNYKTRLQREGEAHAHTRKLLQDVQRDRSE